MLLPARSLTVFTAGFPVKIALVETTSVPPSTLSFSPLSSAGKMLIRPLRMVTSAEPEATAASTWLPALTLVTVAFTPAFLKYPPVLSRKLMAIAPVAEVLMILMVGVPLLPLLPEEPHPAVSSPIEPMAPAPSVAPRKLRRVTSPAGLSAWFIAVSVSREFRRAPCRAEEEAGRWPGGPRRMAG